MGLASATHLAAQLPITRQAVMKHLQVLATAGLVSGSRSGREMLYEVEIDALRASARWLTDLCAAFGTAGGGHGGATTDASHPWP